MFFKIWLVNSSQGGLSQSQTGFRSACTGPIHAPQWFRTLNTGSASATFKVWGKDGRFYSLTANRVLILRTTQSNSPLRTFRKLAFTREHQNWLDDLFKDGGVNIPIISDSLGLDEAQDLAFLPNSYNTLGTTDLN